jgi:hypothetical protein
MAMPVFVFSTMIDSMVSNIAVNTGIWKYAVEKHQRSRAPPFFTL